MTTDCQCELAGYCERHKVKKNKHWHALCRADQSYFNAWENGKGPGQQTSTDAIFYSCPHNHWMPLHAYAVKHLDDWNEAAAKKRYSKWRKKIPSVGSCNCKSNWTEETKELPPDFSSPVAFFEWAWEAHDKVSERIGKPRITLDECYAIWMPGYEFAALQQPNLESIIAVTSLATTDNHLESQSRCLDSWKRAGLSVHVRNTRSEIETLRLMYPQVDEWHPCDESSDVFEKGTQLIYNLAMVAVETGKNILLLNSDIEIRGDQESLLSMFEDSVLYGGIRWNYKSRISATKREEWGIDVFAITPHMASLIPKTPLSIGRPFWDYWLPHHFLSIGYKVNLVGKKLFFHKEHKLNWNHDEWLKAASFVPEITNSIEFRKSLPFAPK